MATIQSTIELYDSFSPVLNNVMDAVNLTIASVEHMQQSLGANMDMTSLDGAVESIHQAGAAMAAINEQMASCSNANINMPAPEPVQVPVHWEVDNMEIFTNTGVERFEQEVQSANSMLNTLNQTQAQIQQAAAGMDILPDSAVQDINSMGNRLEAIQQRIMEISNNPVNIGAEQANTGLEQLRSQLNVAIQEQNNLNTAMQNMDVAGANAAYLRLSNTVGNTEQYIRDNVNEQGRFNQQIRDGTTASNGLLNSIKKMAGVYLGIQGVQKVLDWSDSMASTNARLELLNEMNYTLQTQEELQNAIFASAERSRASYSATASTVAKLGLQASEAFSDTDEIIAFTELMNKSFITGGSSATEQAAAMYQLTQAMSAGKLQGDEYRSIIENAPLLASSIEDYMVNVQQAEGAMKDWASEGLLTADVIKAALFSSADEINERFEQMPMTFEQIWNSITNRALRAFQPFLQKLNDIANSDRFNSMVDGAVGALAVLGSAATEVIDLLVSGAAFVHDNWTIIAPIITGIAVALGLYTAALVANNTVQGVSNMLKTIAAIKSVAHGTATAAEAAATVGMTEAQLSFNAALYTCPITWILVGILLIVAAIYIVIAVINKVCDKSISATGVIVGCIFYIMGAIKNLDLLLGNIFLGAVEAAKAVGHNIKEAFTKSIKAVESVFYGLAAVALGVISDIAAELAKLPFVTFDAAGLSTAAGAYAAEMAAKAKEAADYTPDWQDIGAAWDEGFNSYDYLNLEDEFNRGYQVGENLANKVKEIFNPQEDNENDAIKDYTDLLNTLEGINTNTGSAADTTADIADSLEITDEDLKYLRDIAEREVIDRTVLKSVTIDMSGMTNKVENMQDLDGISTYLAKSLRQQMAVSMEGA